MPRVLIIDDSPSTRHFLKENLSSQGWEVSTEEDAERGAASALSWPPDLILSDLWMPGLSGLQLCRLLHEEPATANIPIVLASATLDRRSRFWAAQSGATLAIEKSQFHELPKLLTALLANTKERAQPAPTGNQVSVSSIPTRLSHLLDKTLFESVVANELRVLGMCESPLGLFEGLARLLHQLVGYQWLALSISERPDHTVACLHMNPEDREEALRDASQALGIDPSSVAHVLSDHRAQRSRESGSAPLIRPIQMLGQVLGAVAIQLAGRAGTDEPALIELVARELAPALRSVLLLEETRRLAATDVLTGLWNRRSGMDTLRQATAVANRYTLPLSLAVIDIDFFKKVNDTYGHNSGDLTLKHVASVLLRTSRTADCLVRWGGEEFLLLMPTTGSAGARIAGERIRNAVASSPARVESGASLEVTVSIGVATHEQETPESLVGRADQALYNAKRRGRNRVEVG